MSTKPESLGTILKRRGDATVQRVKGVQQQAFLHDLRSYRSYIEEAIYEYPLILPVEDSILTRHLLFIFKCAMPQDDADFSEEFVQCMKSAHIDAQSIFGCCAGCQSDDSDGHYNNCGVNAIDQLDEFLLAPPQVKLLICGIRRCPDFIDADREETIFLLELDLGDAEEKLGSEFLNSLSEAAMAYDSKTECAYKTFTVEKRVSLPFDPIKTLVRERIEALLPHFFDRSDCRLQYSVLNSQCKLEISGGSRRLAGSCVDCCITPCLTNPSCAGMLALIGCHGLFMLSWMCCKRTEFVPKNNNVVHFIGTDNPVYWRTKVEAGILPEHFRDIHI